MTRFYFVRHGKTNLNKSGIFFGRTDSPLNEQGICQARALKDSLSLIDFDEIYSSPMKRCIETVEILKSEEEITIIENLVEMDFGLWEGLHYKDCLENYPDEYKNWCNDYKKYSPPNGERYRDFYNRVHFFYDHVLNEVKGNILIISHKGVLQLLTSLLLKGDDSLFWNFDFISGKYSILEKDLNHCTVKNLNI